MGDDKKSDFNNTSNEKFSKDVNQLDKTIFQKEKDLSFKTEKDIDKFEDIMDYSQEQKIRLSQEKKMNKLFSTKEIFDRVGYGLVSNQFLLVFFFIIGAPIFLVGMINGLREMLTILFSSFFKDYSEKTSLGNKFMSYSGLIFGFSFLLIAFSIRLKLIWLFSIAFIFASLGVVIYGELYVSLFNQKLKYEKRNSFLKNIAHNGVIITALSFLLSGAILQYVGLNDISFNFNLFGFVINCPFNGYILIYELGAICFILSSFIISKLPPLNYVGKYSIKSIIKLYFHQIYVQTIIFFNNKKLRLILISVMLIGILQTIGNTYYGYFIYTKFNEYGFGGFMNLSIIFTISIFVSFFSFIFVNFLKKHVGLTPMIVFGSLLLGLLPLTLIYNLHFMAVLIASSFTLIGSSIIGFSHGLIANNLLNRHEKTVYFKSLGIMMIWPYFIFIPIFSFFTHIYGFLFLFKTLLFILLFILLPINIKLVLMSEKQKI
jgi:hypothetical protein